jgi:hypothetical protein
MCMNLSRDINVLTIVNKMFKIRSFVNVVLVIYTYTYMCVCISEIAVVRYLERIWVRFSHYRFL